MANTILINPSNGKGKNDIFRFGGGVDVITIDEDLNDPDNNGFFDGAPGEAGFNIDGGGGNDTITGSRADDTLIGGRGSDTVSGGDGSDTIYAGKQGGDEGKDRDVTFNILYGERDAETITVNGVSAYSDTIFGGDGAAGEGVDIFGTAVFGNALYGDFSSLTVNAGLTFQGGADFIFGGNVGGKIGAMNEIYGDAHMLNLGANAIYTGGVDNITGGTDSVNSIWGDVFDLNLGADSSFTGGADVLTGGDGANASTTMYGDAQIIDFQGGTATFMGGDDRLISGSGSDVMFGDWAMIVNNTMSITPVGGVDTFVFGVSNGSDEIMFYEADKDKIELSGFGFSSFADLNLLWTTQTGYPGLDLTLDLDGNVDGFGDIIVFDGYKLGDQVAFSGDFIFT